MNMKQALRSISEPSEAELSQPCTQPDLPRRKARTNDRARQLSTQKVLNDPRVPRLVSEQQLEEITGIGARTWQDWRLRRKGPKFIKCGRLVRYDLAEVQRYLAARTIETADPSPAGVR
jgi:predicted DNA-binding transcriptional regulator AlpA